MVHLDGGSLAASQVVIRRRMKKNDEGQDEIQMHLGSLSVLDALSCEGELDLFCLRRRQSSFSQNAMCHFFRFVALWLH